MTTRQAPATPSATPSASSDSSPLTARQRAAGSRLLLWLPVPLWGAVAALAIRGEANSYNPSDEFGFAPIMLGLLCTVLGLVALVLALAFSFGGSAFRARGVLATGAWTAVTGVLFAVFGVIVVATGGSGAAEFVAAGVVALVPLVVALAVRPRDDRP